MAETLVATPDEDGQDQSYIHQGIEAAERSLREERALGVGAGEVVIEPVAFAVGALGARSRHHPIGIDRGGFVLHKRHLIDYTPKRAGHISALN